MHPDTYAILAEPRSAELRDKGSRFLALCLPAASEAEARELRLHVEAQYPDASHHCWALRIGHPERALCRDSDAGEPRGSAGAPIARALQAAELSDLLCVVIRWFGGTKLGVGGLIRAYGAAARAALSDAPAGERLRLRRLRGSFAYAHESALRALLARVGGRLESCAYDSAVHWTIALPPSRSSEYEEAAADLLRGRLFEELPESEAP